MRKSATNFLDAGIIECNSCLLSKEAINISKSKMLGYGNGKYFILGLAPSYNRLKVGGYAPYDLEADVADRKESYRLFWKCLKEVNWPTDKTYFTNLLKCSLPEDRDPSKEEGSICSNIWLSQELAIINPKFVICLGNIAYNNLVNSAFSSLFIIKKVFHPSYVARTPSSYSRWVEQWNSLRESAIKEIEER